MQVCSTRDRGARLSFSASLLAGLPPGGGLYQPDPPPDLRQEIAALPEGASFRDVAAAATSRLLEEELAAPPEGPAAAAESLVDEAFPFAPALRLLHDGIVLLELFHGPTCAFKDFGASFLAALLARQLRASPGGQRVVVLVATSGDTGGAVARAFWRRSGIDVVLLYPSGRISRLQEQQLTALGDNVHALEVAGSFDDCQRLVKAALADPELAAAARLCPANSISLGRLLPQAFYYLFAGVRLRSRGQPLFSVPSGNFGNLTAGVYAAWWGLPVAGFLAATNRNDVVPRYLDSGELSPHPSFATLSNAMDVGDPSNFERILARFDHDHASVRVNLRGCAVSDADTLATMRDVHRRDGRLVDPHTAVGIAAARRLRGSGVAGDDRPPLVVLATADAGKFPETVRRATGVEPPIPPSLQELLARPKQATPLEPRSAALRAVILERAFAGG